VATVNDVISRALRRLGVLAEGEVPTYDQANDALGDLNNLLDQWQAEKLQAYTETRTIATLTASQASFTVGAGGNINIARPVFIRHVNFVDTAMDPDMEFQLPQLLTEDAYARITLKAQTSNYPQVAYYNPTYPLGTLIPWPIPTSATLQWAMYHSAPVAQFAALTTTVSLPPGYQRMLVSNLAIEIAPDYGIQPPPGLIMAASDSKAAVKRANLRLMDMAMDAGALVQYRGGRYSYSIYQG
jgi:hypothetical protein